MLIYEAAAEDKDCLLCNLCRFLERSVEEPHLRLQEHAPNPWHLLWLCLNKINLCIRLAIRIRFHQRLRSVRHYIGQHRESPLVLLSRVDRDFSTFPPRLVGGTV